MKREFEAKSPQFHDDSGEVGLLTPRDVCALLGIEQATLAAWRRRKVGPTWYQIQGHLIRYDKGELLKWLRAQRTIPEGAAKASNTPAIHGGKDGQK